MSKLLTASELYAMSQGPKCEGQNECHWCGAPCSRRWLHDEPQPVMFMKRPKTTALRPDSPWICIGCWLFRRTRLTAFFLDGKTYLDRQCPASHSWWITPTEALSIRQSDGKLLFQKLLAPPQQFALLLLSGDSATCLIHQGLANVHDKPVEFGARLKFTVNGVPHTVSPMELQTGLKSKEARTEPGVRVLIDLFGTSDLLPEEDGKRPNHRPPDSTDARILKEPAKDITSKKK